MRIIWDEGAWADYIYWQQQDKKTLKKINNLLKDIDRNGNTGIGKPEPLRNDKFCKKSVPIDPVCQPKRHTLFLYCHSQSIFPPRSRANPRARPVYIHRRTSPGSCPGPCRRLGRRT